MIAPARFYSGREAWDSISDYVERLDVPALHERLRESDAPPLKVIP